MDFKLSSEHAAEALARAQQHWLTEHGTGRSTPTAFSIAFSRQAGTYGAAVAHEVGRRLNWPVYDHELLQRIAADMGVQKRLVESVDERCVSWRNECIAGLMALPGISTTAYYRQLVETLLALAAHGQCVIVGRGASCVLPQATTLRVRLVAPIEHRIQAVRHEHGTSHAEAAAQVDKTDRERNRFVLDHFKCDARDSENYDLVLNCATFTCDEAADLVIAALERRRKHGASGHGGAAPLNSPRELAAV